MTTKTSLSELPDDLPVPTNDGACDHLEGSTFPKIELPSTSENRVSLPENFVLYIYPMTGKPDTPLPDGWDLIPGARGCTPQSCSFRDHYSDLKNLHTEVFGLSSQMTDYQQEAKQRLHLPFDLLSDSHYKLKGSLSLPTFEVDGIELYKRITLIVKNNIIRKIFYPVFPPNLNAQEVIKWLQKNS